MPTPGGSAVPPADSNGGAEPAHCVYVMRMTRVNITVPDELLSRAKVAGLNVSRLASAALADELERLARIAELDAYLCELEGELGPIPDQEIAEAREWADQVLPAGARRPRPARGDRPA